MVSMYGLKIVNGDLAVQGDGNITELTGHERLEQELSCWILEPLGTDRMYSNFGSTLDGYVGSPIIDEYLIDIRAEVTRVVNNYIAYQRQQIQEARNSSTASFINAWRPDDIISSLDDIQIESMADTVKVVVKLTTMTGDEISVEQVV